MRNQDEKLKKLEVYQRRWEEIPEEIERLNQITPRSAAEATLLLKQTSALRHELVRVPNLVEKTQQSLTNIESTLRKMKHLAEVTEPLRNQARLILRVAARSDSGDIDLIRFE